MANYHRGVSKGETYQSTNRSTSKYGGGRTDFKYRGRMNNIWTYRSNNNSRDKYEMQLERKNNYSTTSRSRYDKLDLKNLIELMNSPVILPRKFPIEGNDILPYQLCPHGFPFNMCDKCRSWN